MSGEVLFEEPFDPNRIPPSTGEGMGGLPISPPEGHVVVVVAGEKKTSNNGQGAFLALTYEIIDGPFKGTRGIDRYNLWNNSAQAVQIAMGEYSALCHVCGCMQPSKTIDPLINKPFRVIVGPGKDPKYTEVKVRLFADGRNAKGEMHDNKGQASAPAPQQQIGGAPPVQQQQAAPAANAWPTQGQQPAPQQQQPQQQPQQGYQPPQQQQPQQGMPMGGQPAPQQQFAPPQGYQPQGYQQPPQQSNFAPPPQGQPQQGNVPWRQQGQ